MNLTFSERSFRSLRLSCFAYFHKTLFKGSKRSITVLGGLKSWRYFEFKIKSGFKSLDGPLWGSLVFKFAIFEVRILTFLIHRYSCYNLLYSFYLYSVPSTKIYFDWFDFWKVSHNLYSKSLFSSIPKYKRICFTSVPIFIPLRNKLFLIRADFVLFIHSYSC